MIYVDNPGGLPSEGHFGVALNMNYTRACHGQTLVDAVAVATRTFDGHGIAEEQRYIARWHSADGTCWWRAVGRK